MNKKDEWRTTKQTKEEKKENLIGQKSYEEIL
jgi:hypothetical protein